MIKCPVTPRQADALPCDGRFTFAGLSMIDPRFDEFKKKLQNRLLLTLALLVLATSYGTFGFAYIENAPLFDAFYMAVITMTTVGFAETIPLSEAGRLFAVTAIFAGLICSGLSIGILTNLIFEETLLQVLRGKKMEKIFKKLQGHYIVCGYGTTGRGIVRELAAQGRTTVVVDMAEPDELPSLPPGCLIYHGDACRDSVLRRVGIERAKGLASALTEDADNVFVTLTARALNPGLTIVSRYKSESSGSKLITAGANRVVSPYRMGGKRLALALTSPLIQEVLDLTFQRSALKVCFAHIRVPPGSPLAGKTILETRDQNHPSGALIVGAIDKKGAALFNPPPDQPIDDLDELLALGDDDQIRSFSDFLNGDQAG